MMSRTPSSTFALCAALGLLVVGCNKKADEVAPEVVTGEIMPGSISDAMINLDTSTATPPMAPVIASPKASDKKPAGDGKPAVDEDPAPPEKPAVASADPE